MNYIFASIDLHDTLYYWDIGFKYIFFKDDDLVNKLYDEGGIYLVDLTKRLDNQVALNKKITSFRSAIVFIFLIIFAIFRYYTVSFLKKSDKEKTPIRKFMRRCIFVTIIIIMFIITGFIVIVSDSTVYVSYHVLMSNLTDYIKIFTLYLIPIIGILIDSYKSKKQLN